MFLNSAYHLSTTTKIKNKNKYIYIFFGFQSLQSNREQFTVLAMDIQHIYTTYQNCIISNKLTCTHCVCAFVVLQLQSTNCQPYLNREWHTVLSTAIVESFLFDVVRFQTTNQMLLCFHTLLSCNAHIHIHVIIWGNVYITCIQCTRLRPIHKNEVNQTLQTYTLHAMCASEHC